MVKPLTHSEAAEIVRNEWFKIYNRDPTKMETLYMLAVAYIETRYGGDNQWAPQQMKMAERGHFNWANVEKGMINGICPDGWDPGKDRDKNGNIIDVCLQWWPSHNAAASSLIKNLTKRHWPVIDAANNEGTPEAVAHAMKASPAYYTAPESTYAIGLRNAIAAIGKGLGQETFDENPTIEEETPERGKQSSYTGLVVGGLILGLSSVLVYSTLKIDPKKEEPANG